MAKNDTKNFETYFASVKARGYKNLNPSPHSNDDPLLLDKLATEGHKLLLLENKDKSDPSAPKKTLETVLGEKSNNPYLRARMQILKEMSPSRRERILKLETTNTTEHSIEYREFVSDVAKIGDRLSNKPLDK